MRRLRAAARPAAAPAVRAVLRRQGKRGRSPVVEPQRKAEARPRVEPLPRAGRAQAGLVAAPRSAAAARVEALRATPGPATPWSSWARTACRATTPTTRV